MVFLDSKWLFLLSLIALLAVLHAWRIRSGRLPAIVFSQIGGRVSALWMWMAPAAGYVGVVLLIIAMARPVQLNEVVERKTEGIDIILVVDLSTSMRAEDLRPNRFEAAKAVASEFMDGRTNDRIGLVVFARQSFTLVPPTLDYRLLKRALSDLKMGQVEDGTAIGMGLATAVNRLRRSEAASKVVVLLTDGENNAGEIDPLTAADLAQTFGIRVYTIGASTEGTAPYPIDDPVFGRRYHSIRVDIDEPMLTEMATKTGGRYFRARNTNALREIYSEIDRLERSEVEETVFIDRKDLYPYFLIPGLLFLLLAVAIDRYGSRYAHAA
jgi:Ca-activated chloride channel family protein